jgi:hypothetical protein
LTVETARLCHTRASKSAREHRADAGALYRDQVGAKRPRSRRPAKTAWIVDALRVVTNGGYRIAACTPLAVDMTFENEDDPKKPRPIEVPKKRERNDDDRDRHRHLT